MTHNSWIGSSRASTRALFQALCLAVLIALLMPAAAEAGGNVTRNWKSSSSPLQTPSYDGGRGYAYGYYKVVDTSDGTKFRVGSTRRINTNSGDHYVRTKGEMQRNSGWCASPKFTSCDSAWYPHGWVWGSKTSSTTWKSVYSDSAAAKYSDYTRLRVRVEMIVNNRLDPVSGYHITEGIKY